MDNSFLHYETAMQILLYTGEEIADLIRVA
jgi:hypothetical protein